MACRMSRGFFCQYSRMKRSLARSSKGSVTSVHTSTFARGGGARFPARSFVRRPRRHASARPPGVLDGLEVDARIAERIVVVSPATGARRRRTRVRVRVKRRTLPTHMIQCLHPSTKPYGCTRDPPSIDARGVHFIFLKTSESPERGLGGTRERDGVSRWRSFATAWAATRK